MIVAFAAPPLRMESVCTFLACSAVPVLRGLCHCVWDYASKHVNPFPNPIMRASFLQIPVILVSPKPTSDRGLILGI